MLISLVNIKMGYGVGKEMGYQDARELVRGLSEGQTEIPGYEAELR